MGRVTSYRIVQDNEDVETRDDLLDAMRRARRLAEAKGKSYEIRDARDYVLAVILASGLDTKGMMPRAVRHNAKLTLAEMEAQPRARRCARGGEHDWRTVQMTNGARYTCAKCNVLGYRLSHAIDRVVEHRCVTCGKPATVERKKNVPRYRWSCDAHALD